MNVVSSWYIMSLNILVVVPFHALSDRWPNADAFKKSWVEKRICNSFVMLHFYVTQVFLPEKILHYQLWQWWTLGIWIKGKNERKKQYSAAQWRGSRPVTMLTCLLLEEHSQVQWLAVSSVYQSASLAWHLTALKCHISTVMNWESVHYSQTSLLYRPH